MYKQKVKHLLYEHQNNVAQLKEAGEMALKLQQARHAAPQPRSPTARLASPRPCSMACCRVDARIGCVVVASRFLLPPSPALP